MSRKDTTDSFTREETHDLYRIATGATELYLGWTTPTKANQILANYRLVFPAAKLTKPATTYTPNTEETQCSSK